MSSSTLYVFYDGMLEPADPSQLLACLETKIVEHPIPVLTFENPEECARKGERGSIAGRMNADVPPGAPLSRDIDSTLVTALMPGGRSRPVRTFAVS